MIFRGLTGYATRDPAQLLKDLQRQNGAVSSALDELVREKTAKLVPRRVTADTTAAAGEMVVADGTVTITVPKSSAETAGERVGVVMASSSTVSVAAQSPDLVAGIPVYTMSTPGQLIEFVDDGLGNWWRT